MRKVFMMPTPAQALQDDTNSIHQIVSQLNKTLPKYGWEVSHTPEGADVIASHAGQTYANYPADVAHCHGLYPTGIHGEELSHWAINKRVGDNLREASLITVPSRWVANVVAREFQRDSIVVPWGVSLEDWALKANVDHGGYTLWNKTREDTVCDPTPVRKLAQAIPNARFISTFLSNPPANVEVIGRLEYNSMKEVVQRAALYLATTKETFGIGVLEAMVCGIPILGFNWGAVAEYVEHGVSGFLAEPGDWQGLIDGWHYCMEHRAILGKNARQVARKFPWEHTAALLAKVYDKAYYLKKERKEKFSVSVIIPCHNYGQYLPEAVRSVTHQETDFDFEVIVVDDLSSDRTPEVMQEIQSIYPLKDSHCTRVEYIRNDENIHVAETRNVGIKASTGQFVVCLDADDKLGSPNFLQILHDYLQANPTCGIAYTGLGTFQHSEETQVLVQPWPRQASLAEQFMGHNQIPTCCMFRREAWDICKGYKSYAIPSEDAELWSRIFLAGYTAHQVTEEPLFHYRVHEGSLSRNLPMGKWLQFHPWKNINRFPGGSQVPGMKFSWPVYNYDKPTISIIIPVGPGHERYVLRALDSVFAQTYVNWECIVLNNSGVALDVYPWVRVIECPEVKMRASIVRNMGIELAEAPLITFLDADDFLFPTFLEKTLKEYQRSGKYAYTDWVSINKQGITEAGHAREYTTWAVFNERVIHTINVLIPKKWLQQVRGFDETMHTWEDVDLWMKLASQGFCGIRVPEPLICYDYTSGSLREMGHAISDEVLKPLFASRYGKYMGEDAEVCNCMTAPTAKSSEELQAAALNGDMIRIQYNGPTGKATVIGAVTKQAYGRRANGDIFWMWQDDQQANPIAYVPMPEQNVTLVTTEMPPAPTAL